MQSSSMARISGPALTQEFESGFSCIPEFFSQASGSVEYCAGPDEEFRREPDNQWLAPMSSPSSWDMSQCGAANPSDYNSFWVPYDEQTCTSRTMFPRQVVSQSAFHTPSFPEIVPHTHHYSNNPTEAISASPLQDWQSVTAYISAESGDLPPCGQWSNYDNDSPCQSESSPVHQRSDTSDADNFSIGEGHSILRPDSTGITDTSSRWPSANTASSHGPVMLYPPLFSGYHPPSQHAPVPLSSRSNYSELAAHVPFVDQASADPSPSYIQGFTPQSSIAVQQGGLGWQSSSAPLSTDHSSPSAPKSTKSRGSSAAVSQKTRHSAPEDFIIVPPKLSTIKKNADKKQSLACLFCRERKIACGRPAEGSKDPTCNQCARRSFKCEYPKESRRGQHKRNPRPQPRQGTSLK
ncbi:hypothetical protein HGRIS_012531 [Hohenbuehelia grisea]|uniref:Zn(2)-C6 fungal-type domain-containing protein n=1 Tax=Hohenbuehelia grisea TaxID=104357 RepID=A0ABR3ISJ1_9AGAR